LQSLTCRTRLPWIRPEGFSMLQTPPVLAAIFPFSA